MLKSDRAVVKVSQEQLPTDIQLGYSVLPEPGSEPSAQLMRHWIQTCDETHQCMAAVVNSGLPKRLLTTDYHLERGVRLCSTADMRPDVRYTALSFVWGTVNMDQDRTVRENLARYEQAIDYGKLSKTFRDAIEITHRLGIKYLWIDSLCIVQDLLREELSEIAQMGDIFSNAYCVLIASSAMNISEGLFKPRSERAVVPLKQHNGVPISICNFIDDFQKDVDATQHSFRGWTYQERVLARRTIFFTSTQTYWQCGEGIRCETLTKLHKYVAFKILITYTSAFSKLYRC